MTGHLAPLTRESGVLSQRHLAVNGQQSTVNGRLAPQAPISCYFSLLSHVPYSSLLTPHSSLVVQGGAGCGQQHVGIESYLVIGICILELDDAVSVHDESGRDREQVMGFS